MCVCMCVRSYLTRVAAWARLCVLHLQTAVCDICRVSVYGEDGLILAAGWSWGHENAAALQLWDCDRRKSLGPRNLPNLVLSNNFK